MWDMFNPHVNPGRAYTRYVCAEILKHPTFKSYFVVGLACFDSCVVYATQGASYGLLYAAV